MFILPNDFVADALTTRKRDFRTKPMADAQQRIVAWINQRDRTKHDPVEIPVELLGQLSVADNADLKRALTGSGVGSVVCDECRETYRVADTVEQMQPARAGWNFALRCYPCGHRLVIVESVHIVTE